MIAVNGIYENGMIRLERKIKATKSVKVIVTFLDEELSKNLNRLELKDFSFMKSREKSKRYEGSLSDAVIDERNADL